MIIAIIFGVCFLTPRLLNLDRARPSVAASILLSTLMLRATLVVFAAVYLLAILPGSAPLEGLSKWCWNATFPVSGVHLGFSGVLLTQALLLLPLLMTACWAMIRTAKLVKAHIQTRRAVSSRSLGAGPEGSVIVGGSSVMLAAAGLVRPEVVLSAGALTALDDAELAAGIAHERGHIARQHRWWTALAEIFSAVGRPIPGTAQTLAAFKMHLERDADRWAVDRTRDPLALASAICKSAVQPPARIGTLTALSGASAVLRVDQLLDLADGRLRLASAQRLLGPLALLLTVMAIAGVLVVPSAATAGIRHLGEHAPPGDCRF